MDLMQKMSTHTPAPEEAAYDRISKRIEKFSYNSDLDNCFNLWFDRHKDIFKVGC